MVDSISELLKREEGTDLEFKAQFPEKQTIAAVLCAFANSAGGDLIIGVSDHKPRKVVGLGNSDVVELEHKISSIAANAIAPRIAPFVRIINVKGNYVLAVHVEQGYQRPYKVVAGRSAGRVFVRVGSTTRKADSATIQRLHLQSSGMSWDALPYPDLTLQELDNATIEDFLRLRTERRGIPRPAIPRERWMKKMQLATETGGRPAPTMAAVLLFSSSPRELLPQAGLEMARFKGTAPDEFLDKASADRPIWKLYEESLDFLRKHITTHARRTSHGRKERMAYPELAFREFMVNALCHRSYEPGSGPVHFAIFDDIIEITNSGPLPEGLDLTDLGTGVSVLRNPVIARVFNEMGLIEGWGTGIKLAMNKLAKHNLPPARIEMKGFFTQVSSVWAWPKEMKEEDVKIMRAVSSKGKIASAEVAEMFQVSDRTARTRLAALVKRGLLKKVGSTRSAVYVRA
jgi:predicted HTH transcriptional regulator